MAITITPVQGDTTRFIKSQWQFYAQDPNWVPPLIMDRKKLLDTKKNPFYKHARIQLFLAEENGRIVGRIAAIINDNHNTTHNDKVGFFGFFECENRPEVAQKLFQTAEQWLKERGMNVIRGPVNPSMNDEVGLLVEGFNMPPVVLMTYNPPYYANLIEGYGFTKAKDLYAYLLKNENYQSEKMERLQGLIRQRYGITIRQIDFEDKAQFKKDVDLIKDIYNKAWQPNWGFVKMTDEEFDFLAADLKQIARPELVFFVEIHGKPAGFLLGLPNINQMLIHNKSGNILTGVWHLLTKKKSMDIVRIIVMGLLPEYQRTGADAVMYYEIGKRGKDFGLIRGEASWILEDNIEMNLALNKTMHGDRYKTYRIYDKEIA